MIRQQSKRVAKIEASLQVGLQAPPVPTQDEWTAMSNEEAARRYFVIINAPMCPALAAASRASIASISPVEAMTTYKRIMGVAA